MLLWSWNWPTKLWAQWWKKKQSCYRACCCCKICCHPLQRN